MNNVPKPVTPVFREGVKILKMHNKQNDNKRIGNIIARTNPQLTSLNSIIIRSRSLPLVLLLINKMLLFYCILINRQL
jgi:hypothetical protein